MIAQPGSYLAAVLLLAGGAFLFSNLEGYQLLNGIQSIGERVQELLEGDPAKQAQSKRQREEKNETACRSEKKQGSSAANKQQKKEAAEYEKEKAVNQQRKILLMNGRNQKMPNLSS